MPGQFVAEAHIPIGPLAQRKPVDPDFAIGHHAIELHEHAARRGIGGQHKVFAVPAHSAGQKRARSARRSLFVEGAFDAPIVGQADGTPG